MRSASQDSECRWYGAVIGLLRHRLKLGALAYSSESRSRSETALRARRINGVTTLQLSRLVKRRGYRCLVDFVRLRLRGEGGDKWALVWGCASADASLSWRLRVLLLPSLPSSSALSRACAGWTGGLSLLVLLALVVLGWVALLSQTLGPD